MAPFISPRFWKNILIRARGRGGGALSFILNAHKYRNAMPTRLHLVEVPTMWAIDGYCCGNGAVVANFELVGMRCFSHVSRRFPEECSLLAARRMMKESDVHVAGEAEGKRRWGDGEGVDGGGGVTYAIEDGRTAS